MKHLSDGSTSDTSPKHERRVDSLQVSVIEASTFSTASDTLRMHERHFNGDTGSGENCVFCCFTRTCVFGMFFPSYSWVLAKRPAGCPGVGLVGKSCLSVCPLYVWPYLQNGSSDQLRF